MDAPAGELGGPAGAEANFVEDDGRAQGGFGVITGGSSIVKEEGKKLILGRGVGQDAFA